MSTAGLADARKPEPDVYKEIRSLARQIGADRVVELGCGTGCGLVTLYPGLQVVGIDDGTAITQCREQYTVGDWIEANADGTVDIPDSILESAIVLLSERGARSDTGFETARSALDGGALAVVVALAESDRWSASEFRRLLALHRLDAHIGRTAFGSAPTDAAFMLALAPGRDRRMRETVATWWSERQAWERQLTRLAGQQVPRHATAHHVDDPSARAGSAHIVVVTESAGENAVALRRTAESLVAQTFDCWSWTIVAQRSLPAPLDDPRIATLRTSARAAGLAASVADADLVALVDEGVDLRETTFEKWLWFLETHPQYAGVTGSRRPTSDARLYRREAIEAAGGIDAAWAIAEPLGRVPYTGGRRASGDDSMDPAGAADPPGAPRTWVADTWPFRNLRPSKKPQILLIAPWMALGGADRVNLDVLRALKNCGWGITVATTRTADHTLYTRFETITSDLFPLADFVALDDYPRVLDYLIDSRRPDVVLTSQSELGYRLLPYLRSRHRRPAFVDLCHSEVEDWYGGGFPRFSIEYQSLLDRTIVVSGYLRDWMVKRGADPDRVTVCHANVDHVTFAPDAAARERLRQRFALAEDESIVLWVGRMSIEKQPRLLPRISGALHRRGIRHVMLVVGDGHERCATEELAMSEPDSNVVFLGALDHGALPSLYAASDVVVLPSRIEGIALTLFEAMSAGVPVVAARVGGQAELITGEVGVLVEPSPEETEVDRYAAALADVLHDPPRRAEMGHAARARIEGLFTPDVMQTRIQQILEKAIEQHRESPRVAPDLWLGRALASEAIELTRLEGAWQPPSFPPTRRERVYRAAQRIGGPAYRWADERRFPGLRTARNLAHRAVLGR